MVGMADLALEDEVPLSQYLVEKFAFGFAQVQIHMAPPKVWQPSRIIPVFSARA